MKIIGVSRDCINVEVNGKIARFWGEPYGSYDGFMALIGTMEWIYPDEHEATYEETILLIQTMKSEYRKLSRKERKLSRVIFCDDKWKKIDSIKRKKIK